MLRRTLQKTFIGAILLAVGAASPAWAIVQGSVTNTSTGERQAGVTVNLVQPGAGGMQQIGTTTSGANGAFEIDATPTGVALVQAVYRNVTYTTPLPPGSSTTGLEVTVYEAVPVKPTELTTQHLVLLEPTLTELSVSETFFLENPTKFTYQPANEGALSLYLPENTSLDAGALRVTVDSTGVPITRPLVAAGGGRYTIDYPIKPGETRFDLKYQLPPTEMFSLRTATTPTRLITPANVMLIGEGIEEIGVEPSTQARVYNSSAEQITVDFEGIGALTLESEGAPQCCEEVPPRVYTREVRTPFGEIAGVWVVLSMGLLILALGGFLLYRRGGANPVPAAATNTAPHDSGGPAQESAQGDARGSG